jgi:CBS domain-containing protein
MSLGRFRRPIVVAAEDECVTRIAQKMRDAHVGCVVLTRDARPVGVLTDRDLALRIVADGREPETTLASDVATYAPLVVSEADGIETAAARMREHGVRRLPIVDAEGIIVGMVTADDLMVLLGREFADLCDGIDASSDSGDSR